MDDLTNDIVINIMFILYKNVFSLKVNKWRKLEIYLMGLKLINNQYNKKII